LLLACQDARLSGSNGPADETAMRDRPAYNPNSGGIPGEETPIGDRRFIMIPAVSDTSIAVGYEGRVDLGVYLFGLGTGEPAPDETVQFTMTEAPVGGSHLTAANAFTDSAGQAAIRFEAGDVPAVFQVIVSHPEANSVSYDVTVLDLPVGSLEVTVVHPAASVYDVSPITVRLYPREILRCDFLAPGEYPSDYFVGAELGSTRETALFENLLADEIYTVLGTGFGEIGEIAAQGCMDDVHVQEGLTREIDLILQLLPLNPVGEYDVQSWWDFTDALLDTGSVGSIIVDILDLFENPGEQILDYMVDAIGYFLGSWISDVIEIFLSITRLDRLIEDAINDLINSSPALRGFFSLGCDLRRMVTRLQVISILSIGKIGSDFEVFGVDTWTGLGVCDFTVDDDFTVGECDSRPDCERIPIIVEDGSLGLLRGDWTGRILSYNTLQIDRYPIDFNYGRLILFILENYIFPILIDEPAPVSLEDVLFSIINCDAFADFITGSDGEICVIGCISHDDIEGFCEGAVSLVFGTFFNAFVTSLSFDSVIDLRGTCTLVNDDTDLDVEFLEDGQYLGTIYVDGEGSPFSSDFIGQRRE
jgi:hypothetical protein